MGRIGHRIKIASFVLLVIAVAAVLLGWSFFSCGARPLLTRLSQTYPGCVYFMQTDEPVIALTIDDGPDSLTTPKILDVLSRNNAKATFFLISSRVTGNEDLVAQMVARDHEIANHLTYDEPSVNLTPEEFREALCESDSILTQFDEVRWFRPGGGRYNEQMITVLQRQDYRCALGSVYPFDTVIPWVWFEVQYVLHNVQSGSIIILHDGVGRGRRTAAALERILPELSRRGFRFVTLSELYQLKKD